MSNSPFSLTWEKRRKKPRSKSVQRCNPLIKTLNIFCCSYAFEKILLQLISRNSIDDFCSWRSCHFLCIHMFQQPEKRQTIHAWRSLEAPFPCAAADFLSPSQISSCPSSHYLLVASQGCCGLSHTAAKDGVRLILWEQASRIKGGDTDFMPSNAFRFSCRAISMPAPTGTPSPTGSACLSLALRKRLIQPFKSEQGSEVV